MACLCIPNKCVTHFPRSESRELQLSHGNTFDVVQKYLMTMLDFQMGKCQYNVGAEVGWLLTQEAAGNKCRLKENPWSFYLLWRNYTCELYFSGLKQSLAKLLGSKQNRFHLLSGYNEYKMAGFI